MVAKNAWSLTFPPEAPARRMIVIPVGLVAQIIEDQAVWNAHTFVGVQARPWEEHVDLRISDVIDDPTRLIGKYPVVVTHDGLFEVIEHPIQLVTLPPAQPQSDR